MTNFEIEGCGSGSLPGLMKLLHQDNGPQIN